MKKNNYFLRYISASLLLVLLLVSGQLFSATGKDTLLTKALSSKIEKLMEQGNIPGLSLAILKGDETITASFGLADADKKTKVTPATLFEIGSCSKAFTALAILKLESEGVLHLNDPVTDFLPWFNLIYKGEKQSVTIEQLLHHTSGIPFKTISSIPQDSSAYALEATVKLLASTELARLPGTAYEYATINYDVLGLIIQKVTGDTFENYLVKHIFYPMGMYNTTVGIPNNKQEFATAYKIGFFAPRYYQAPVFRGNYPAGYVVSDIKDMLHWLQLQLDTRDSDIYSPLISRSHQPDLSVTPFNNFSYAAGWMVNQYGKRKIAHDGNNPNFTSSIVFYPESKTGVVVLANSNSTYTPLIADLVLNTVAGNPPENSSQDNDRVDVMCSILCIVLAAYILLVTGFLIVKLKKIIFRQDKLEKFSWKKLKRLAAVVALGLPYFYGIYLVPEALVGFSWKAIFIWTPLSFTYLVYLLTAGIGITYLFYSFSLFSGNAVKYKNELPLILFLSVISGLANTAVLFIITTAFYSTVPIYYLLYYFALAYGLYVIGMKVSQTKTIYLTNNITFDIRTFLINRITKTRFQNFEKLTDGAVLTTLNGDTTTLANSANVFISFITNFITIFSAFLYMATISFFSTLIVLGVVALLVWYYYLISEKARVFMEESRNIVNTYMSLLNNLIYGFRELSLHYLKKLEFRKDFIDVNGKFNEASIKASVKFLDSSIIGNSFIMIVLGILSIVIPRVSSEINTITLISFVMVLLYIIGPINTVLATVQELTMVRVSWGRIAEFISELDVTKQKVGFWEMIGSIKATVVNENKEDKNTLAVKRVEHIDIKNLLFEYKNPGNVLETFKLGPVDLSINAGEVVFIIGGNGSGKSTLLHLLTGLYVPDKGYIRINNVEVKNTELGEYFAVIFGNDYLFQKIYGIGLDGRENEIRQLLERFKLKDKVEVKDNAFSTIDLSSGQKKRLALLKCFLEDRQVFIFDEFAADQDPDFRRFFYRELLPELKKTGKIIIAITHDDHYFDVADKVLKLNYGTMDSVYASGELLMEKV